jgi:hypothetical protein
MKPYKYILVIILALNGSMLFAGSDNFANNPPKTDIALLLSPVIPKEATFEEVPDLPGFLSVTLAPVTPKVATFDDTLPVEINSESLSPEIPAEADFEILL